MQHLPELHLSLRGVCCQVLLRSQALHVCLQAWYGVGISHISLHYTACRRHTLAAVHALACAARMRCGARGVLQGQQIMWHVFWYGCWLCYPRSVMSWVYGMHQVGQAQRCVNTLLCSHSAVSMQCNAVSVQVFGLMSMPWVVQHQLCVVQAPPPASAIRCFLP
jgi:hypothetical protein